MRNLAIPSTVLVVAIIAAVSPASAQNCSTASPANVSYFKLLVKHICGLTPSDEESKLFICSQYPRGFMVQLANQYCSLNG